MNILWACYMSAHFIPHQHYQLILDVISHNLFKFKRWWPLCRMLLSVGFHFVHTIQSKYPLDMQIIL